MEIEASEVVKCMLQFFVENNMVASFQAVQADTGVMLSVVENTSLLASLIKSGEWDRVLVMLKTVQLSPSVSADLYELVILDLLRAQQEQTALQVLKSVESVLAENPERYIKLESLTRRNYFDDSVYPLGSVRKARSRLAKLVLGELSDAPPSRLLDIVGQAMKWQQYMGQLPAGTRFDLFKAAAPSPKREDEQVPNMRFHQITFGEGSKGTCVSFSPDGLSLATGSTDGFVEIYNWLTGTLRKDLEYQAVGDLMMHSGEVTCVEWSRDSELLVSGDSKGSIKVWQVRTGKCVRRFKAVHEMAVSSVRFSRDHASVYSSSYDTTVRTHGLRSGKTLKVMRGHSSYVQNCLRSGKKHIISSSTDGTVKVWMEKTGDCIQTINVATVGPGEVTPAISHISAGRDSETFLVCDSSDHVTLVDIKGTVISVYTSLGDLQINHAFSSSLGRYMMALGSDHRLHCFSYDDAKEIGMVQLEESAVAGGSVHPHQNIVAVLDAQGVITLLKPDTST